MIRTPDREPAPGAEAGGAAARLLDRKVRASFAILLFERAWRALLWPFVVMAAFLLVSLLGLWAALPVWAHKVLLAAFAAGALVALVPLFRIVLPTRAEALRRLERASGIRHRPATSYEDVLPVHASARDKALWAAHRAHLAALLDRLRIAWPRPRLDRSDPFALRVLLVLLLAVAFLASGRASLERMGESLAFGPPAPPAQFRLNAWVTPPIYTRAPPVVLADGVHYSQAADEQYMRRLSVPEQSILVVRVNADEGALPELAFLAAGGEEPIPLEPSSEVRGVVDYRLPLTDEGAVTVSGGAAALATWHFDIVEDAPPRIELVETPQRTARGALQLTYRVEDDYGVTGAQARFTLAGEPDEPAPASGEPGSEAADAPLYAAPDMPLSLPRANAKTAESRAYKDLTAHPWAGLKVSMTLVAVDQAGQEGRSEPFEMILPARNFDDPLARAIVEQRRNLVRSPADRSTVAEALDALTIEPQRFIEDRTVYLGLRTAHWRLQHSTGRAAVASTVDLLWDIALRIEDGDLPAAEEALRTAQERLMRAIEDGAPEHEIQRLMEELRQALNQFMQALAERARQQGLVDPEHFGDGQTMTSQDLEDLLDRIEQLATSGSQELAQQLMNQLRDMLERMQMGAMAQNPQAEQMMQSVEGLGEIVREQQQLLDDTFQALRDLEMQDMEGQDGVDGREGAEGMEGLQGQRGQGQQGQGRQGQGRLGELGQRQGELRQRLSQLMDELRQLGVPPPDQLDGAGQAMQDAEGALADGDLDRATQEETLALDRLRQGTQQMAEQMMQMMIGQMGQGPSGNAPRDPLGRPDRTRGPDLGLSVQVPDEIDIQRAREILQELRRRLGDPQRPTIELDYLERLLRQY